MAFFTINLEFVRAIKPPHIVLVHGEANEMARTVLKFTPHISEQSWAKGWPILGHVNNGQPLAGDCTKP